MTASDIRKLRNRMGLTQQAFAEKIGLSHWSRISELENGHRKPSKAVEIILQSFKKSLDN